MSKGGRRSGAGRPPVAIDLTKLEKLSALGCTHEEIAGIFGVSVRTIELRRKKQPEFAAAMDHGRAQCMISVRRAQLKWMARDPSMCRFLGKTMLGQRDVTPVELSGPNNTPMKFTLEVLDEIFAHKKKA